MSDADVTTEEAAVEVADGEVAEEGALAAGVLEYLAKQLVEDASQVKVEIAPGRRTGVELRLSVAPGDVGKVIGRRGRVAQALRTVARAAAAKEGTEIFVEILD